jgi:hypothetical protein
MGVFCRDVCTVETYHWGTVAIGGGGYVTGMAVHPTEPGLVYIRTDVGGAYRLDPEKRCWIQLFDWVPFTESHLYGVDGIAVDPSDPDIVYTANGNSENSDLGGVFKSIDRGSTWVNVLNRVGFLPGRNGKCQGECIAVDPLGGQNVVVGTRAQGIWQSGDGGKNWERVRRDGMVRTVAFDPRGTIVYAGIYDLGVAKSITAGKSWTFLKNSPRQPNRIAVGIDGTLYVTSEQGVFKYAGNEWNEITPSVDGRYFPLAIHFHNENMVACGIRWGGFIRNMFVSTDKGDHWLMVSDSIAVLRGEIGTEADVPWWPAEYFASNPSAMAFDPFSPSKLYVSDWYGVWISDDVLAPPFHWYTHQCGHEETFIMDLACPPAGPVVMSVSADNCGYRNMAVDRYPDRRFPANTPGGITDFNGGSGVDFCENHPEYVGIIISSGWSGKGTSFAMSRDGAETWEVKGNPGGTGGKIAYSATNTDNLVYLGYNKSPRYTTDGGESWHSSSGAPSGAINSSSLFDWQDPLCADRVNGSTFYLFHGDDFYRSTDGGKNWSRTGGSSSLPSKGSGAFVNVKAAPGSEGRVWVSLGSRGVWRSSDRGERFEKIPFFENSRIMGWGTHAPGESYPTAYVFGLHDHTWGLYRSTDRGENWIRINDETSTLGKNPVTLEGDRQVYSRVYVGSRGRGIYYGAIEEGTRSRTVSRRIHPQPQRTLRCCIHGKNKGVRIPGSIAGEIGVEIFSLTGKMLYSTSLPAGQRFLPPPSTATGTVFMRIR